MNNWSYLTPYLQVHERFEISLAADKLWVHFLQTVYMIEISWMSNQDVRNFLIHHEKINLDDTKMVQLEKLVMIYISSTREILFYFVLENVLLLPLSYTLRLIFYIYNARKYFRRSQYAVPSTETKIFGVYKSFDLTIIFPVSHFCHKKSNLTYRISIIKCGTSS